MSNDALRCLGSTRPPIRTSCLFTIPSLTASRAPTTTHTHKSTPHRSHFPGSHIAFNHSRPPQRGRRRRRDLNPNSACEAIAATLRAPPEVLGTSPKHSRTPFLPITTTRFLKLKKNYPQLSTQTSAVIVSASSDNLDVTGNNTPSSCYLQLVYEPDLDHNMNDVTIPDPNTTPAAFGSLCKNLLTRARECKLVDPAICYWGTRPRVFRTSC